MYIEQLRKKFNLSDDSIVIPVDLEEIQIKKKVLEEIQNEAENIAKEYFYNYEDVISALTARAFILDTNELVVIADLPKSIHYVKIEPTDWKYNIPPILQ